MKINTREELTELLNGYKGILNDLMINYLNSLINLEFSVIREYINDDDRLILSELEVYKKIAVYNIYNRALNIFKQNESNLRISGNNDEIERLYVCALFGKKNCKLFDFNYREGPIGFETKIPKDYKTMKIGDISLFQTIESKEKSDAELSRVMNILDRLYDEKNPHFSRPYTYGGPASQWEFNHAKKIKEYENKFKQLLSRTELTEEEKQEVEVTKKFHELLLEDYGLTDKDFKEESSSDFSQEKTKLNKTLIRRMPNINIKNNIKYI